jgi:hypothetical protein
MTNDQKPRRGVTNGHWSFVTGHFFTADAPS